MKIASVGALTILTSSRHSGRQKESSDKMIIRNSDEVHNVHDVLSRLKNVKKTGDGWSAQCPTHDDQKNSLTVNAGTDYEALLFCHAGCTYKQIAEALNLKQTKRGAKRIVAEYDYYDEQGELLYQTVRYEPKTFRQRRPDGQGGWVWKTKDMRRILYRLPELLEADPSMTVFVCEGEKDVEALLEQGLVATTNVGGAGKWRDEYNEHLVGRDVVVLPDNDDAGRRHAEQVARSLQGVASSVRMVRLPELSEHGDVYDWLKSGNTSDALLALAEAAPDWTPSAEAEAEDGKEEGQRAERVILSYEEFMNVTFGAGEEIAFELQRREVGLIVSVTNVGKSTLVRNCVLSAAAGREFPPFVKGGVPRRVGLLDFETGGRRLQDDLRRMTRNWSAAERKLLSENFFVLCEGMVGEDLLSLTKHLPLIKREAEERAIDLLVIDTCGAAFDLFSENDNGEVARKVMKPLMKMARRLDCAVMTVHHIGKSKSEEGNAAEKVHRPRGASAFSGYAGSVFVLTADAGDTAAVTATCAKNKNGAEYEVLLKHDRDARWFRVIGTPTRTPTNYERVVEFVVGAASPVKLAEIVTEFKGVMSRDTVKRKLSDAVRRDDLISTGHGLYAAGRGANGASLFNTHLLHLSPDMIGGDVEDWFEDYVN